MAATHGIFEAGIMASTQLDSYLRSVKAHADLDNGHVVAITGLETGEDDYWTAAAASDVTADDLWVVDSIKRTLFDDKYAYDHIKDVREFYVPSGFSARARKLMKGDTCRISLGTVTGEDATPANDIGKYLIPANGALTWAVAADLTGNTVIALKIVGVHTFYVGSTTVTGFKCECVVA